MALVNWTRKSLRTDSHRLKANLRTTSPHTVTQLHLHVSICIKRWQTSKKISLSHPLSLNVNWPQGDQTAYLTIVNYQQWETYCDTVRYTDTWKLNGPCCTYIRTKEKRSCAVCPQIRNNFKFLFTSRNIIFEFLINCFNI